jgi:hypothetical protein
MATGGFAIALGVLVTSTTSTVAHAEDVKARCVSSHEQAQRQRRAGHLLRAREHAITCAQSECPAPVRAECSPWVAELEAQLPTLVVTVEDLSQRPVADAAVRIDGVDTPADGRPVTLDPGLHDVTCDARGVHSKQAVAMVVGEKLHRVAFRMPFGARPPSQVRGGTQRFLGWTGLIVGGAGLSLGGISGGLALGRLQALETKCTNGRCPPSVSDDVDSYTTWRTVSTISFIAGAALAVGGTVLLFTAPASSSTAPTVSLVPFGIVGTF